MRMLSVALGLNIFATAAMAVQFDRIQCVFYGRAVGGPLTFVGYEKTIPEQSNQTIVIELKDKDRWSAELDLFDAKADVLMVIQKGTDLSSKTKRKVKFERRSDVERRDYSSFSSNFINLRVVDENKIEKLECWLCLMSGVNSCKSRSEVEKENEAWKVELSEWIDLDAVQDETKSGQK